MINAGRPLIFNWTADHVPAIVYTWWLGSEAGDAIADVLFGDYNPSGKITHEFSDEVKDKFPFTIIISVPAGRLKMTVIFNYVSSYIDLPNSPKFPFGYGLSYSSFQYSNLQLSKTKMKSNEKIEAAVTVKNTGKYDGEETVQLYLRDKVGSIVRPVKELKDFQIVNLKAGETKTIQFFIDKEKLSFYNQKLQWVAEPGEFELMIGASSEDIRLKENFELVK